MGKSPPPIPDWCDTIWSMLAAIDASHSVHARCDQCGARRELARKDLERIGEKKGLRFRLVGKRTRCRLTPGCEGWNTFAYREGSWLMSLHTEADMLRWIAHDGERDRRARECMSDFLKGHGRRMDEKKARERH